MCTLQLHVFHSLPDILRLTQSRLCGHWRDIIVKFLTELEDTSSPKVLTRVDVFPYVSTRTIVTCPPWLSDTGDYFTIHTKLSCYRLFATLTMTSFAHPVGEHTPRKFGDVKQHVRHCQLFTNLRQGECFAEKSLPIR